MYVLVRRNLEPIHRAVQAGHAVAEYFKEHSHNGIGSPAFYKTPKAKDNKYQSDSVTKHPAHWDNGFLIYLSVANEIELSKYEAILKADGSLFSTFVEPDWEDGPTKTATACVGFGELFQDLELLDMNSNEVDESIKEYSPISGHLLNDE